MSQGNYSDEDTGGGRNTAKGEDCVKKKGRERKEATDSKLRGCESQLPSGKETFCLQPTLAWQLTESQSAE